MSKSDEIRLRHMLDAAREAVDLCAGRSRTDLLEDRVLTLALVRCIEIIMRNRLIHAYFDIDLDRVLDTLAGDLPPLIAAIERIVHRT